MVKEVLKKIWFKKPWLMSTLSSIDMHSRMRVGVRTFLNVLKDMNSLPPEGGSSNLTLTEAQMGSICEIAARGGNEVEYQTFLLGLNVRGTEPCNEVPAFPPGTSHQSGAAQCTVA